MDNFRKSVAYTRRLGNNLAVVGVRGRTMAKQEAGYDYTRYRKLLAEAVDEARRLELINILINEHARDMLEAQRTSDRVAMTAQTVARILGPTARRDNLKLG